MLQKGETIEAEIIDLNHMAQGVAKIDNFVVFIKGAVTGDVVQAEIKESKKNYAVGKLIKIIRLSQVRINPPCVYYEQCGGCQLMHMNYLEQLIYKRSRVINELKRSGVSFEESMVKDTIGMEEPFRYRNKTTFSVSMKSNQVSIGPYEQGTYNTVDINSCLLQNDDADNVIRVFKELMIKHGIKAYDKKTGKGTVKNIVIRTNRMNHLMLIIVTSSENLRDKEMIVKDLTLSIPSIKTIVQNINTKNTNLVLGTKNITLYGAGTITDTIDDLVFTISPETFFQINSVQTEKLYKTAIEYADISKDDTCFDIYCGIGTISLMAARQAGKVYGVEVVEQSIINAKENAKSNNIDNVEFFAGKAEQIVPKLYSQNIKATIVILDPPRKGCEKQVIDTIINMAPQKVIYVSCNPSTLARDIKLLESGGFKLQTAQPVDQFPWTEHVECVILMTYCGSESKK